MARLGAASQLLCWAARRSVRGRGHKRRSACVKHGVLRCLPRLARRVLRTPDRFSRAHQEAHRNCTLVKSCVLGRPATVTFQSSKPGNLQLSGGAGRQLRSRNKRVDAHHLDLRSRSPSTRTLTCVSLLVETLRSLGLLGRTIDLLSIDIEGAEPGVLRCMPWAHIDVRAVLIETNKLDLRVRASPRYPRADISACLSPPYPPPYCPPLPPPPHTSQTDPSMH